MRVIRRLEKGPKRAEVIVHFQDGSQEKEGFLGHKPKCQLKGPFAQPLGLDVTPMGDIKTGPPFLQTSVRGVFAALDDSSPIKSQTTHCSQERQLVRASRPSCRRIS